MGKQKTLSNTQVYLDTLNINKDILLTEDQTNELVKLAKQGDKQALNSLCKYNYRLVYKVVDKHLALIDNKLELQDLMQVGFMGIIKAVEKYDNTKDTKFTTYSVWWIKQYIIREIQEQLDLIRLPSYLQQNIHVMNKAYINFKQQYQREPHNLLEFSNWLKANKEDYRLNNEWEYEVSYLYKFNKFQNLQKVDTLQRKINTNDKDTTMTLEDSISSDIYNPEKILWLKEVKQIVIKAIKESKLSDRDKNIILDFYGFNKMKEEPNLRILSEKYNLSAERIRQITLKAIEQLKLDPKIQALSEEEWWK